MVLAVRDVRGQRPAHVQRDTSSPGMSRTGTSEVVRPLASRQACGIYVFRLINERSFV